MTSLIDKIEMLIKREKTTPERKKKDDSTKSSSEILSELFGAFNAAPPKIDEKISSKKSKKSKKKHKKDKKKRSRSSSSSSSQSDSDYSHKHKKRKKNKKKSRDDRSPSRSRSKISPNIKLTPELKVKPEPIKFKHDPGKIKTEDDVIDIKKELKKEPVRRASIKIEDSSESKSVLTEIDTSLIPMPDSPKLETEDLRHKLDGKRTEVESDKAKGKIQIKNLKFSAVFEETVKKAEEEARKKKEKYEEGEVTDSSSSSEKDRTPNAQFPKMSDPGGIMKRNAEEIKVPEEDKISSKRTKHSDSSRSKKDRGRSRSRSRRRSRSSSRRYHRSSSRSRHGGIRTHSRSRRRSRSRSRGKARYPSPKHRDRGRRSRSRDAGVKLADSEKKRLLEVARRNAINMLKNGAVPAGAAALPPHTRNQVMAAIQSGGKSVDELTDFCKHLSKKEALGELSSASSDDNMSENEDTLAFHHPFLVKEKAPIVMNIRGGAPLPIKSSLAVANKDELRLQFPVSSGTQHRDTEWVPVSPKKDNMQVAKLSSSKPPSKSSAPTASVSEKPTPTTTAPLPLPPPPEPPAYMKSFISNASQLSTVPSLPVPGPQAYPPGVEPPKIDLAAIVSQKLLMIRKEQEQNEVSTSRGLGFSSKSSTLGQFTGSTGAQILTPRELASGTQAWAKKDQLVRAAPVQGGMGALLLQKMGWTPGRGLGKEGTGTLQPLMLEVKLDTRGLSAKEEVGGRGKGMKMQRMPKRSVPALPLASGGKHPVSLLGEYCSKNKLGPPEYTLCFECGPDHKKNFLFKVKVATTEYQPAVASANKKQAKADSAQLALQKLGIL